MNAVLVNMGRGTAIVLGLALASAAFGQAPRPAPVATKQVVLEPAPAPVVVEPAPKPAQAPITAGAHRMEIVSGQGISVRYFGKGLAPTEMAALRDLERAENDALYADSMAMLRQLYVTNEMQMENKRHSIQLALYGTSIVTTEGSGMSGYTGSPTMGYGAIPNNLALVQNPYYPGATIYPNQPANNQLYPNVYTPGYWGNGNFGGTATTLTSLQNGIGDEGRMKTEIAKAMAAQYTPDTVTAAHRAVEAAAARVVGYPRLRDGLGQSDPSGIALAGYGPMTLTLKDGKELKGTLLREDADWLYVQTGDEDVSIRKSEVTKTARPRQK